MMHPAQSFHSLETCTRHRHFTVSRHVHDTGMYPTETFPRIEARNPHRHFTRLEVINCPPRVIYQTQAMYLTWTMRMSQYFSPSRAIQLSLHMHPRL